MGTDAAVVMAYRDMGCAYRRASFNYVKAFYESCGYPVFVDSGTDDASFTRASGINAAVRRAAEWSHAPVIIQSDPDSLIDPEQLKTAVRLASAPDAPLVIPHDQYLYTTEHAAQALLDAEIDLWGIDVDACEFHGNDGSGNVVVFRHDLWEQVGGFDERFGLWGGDDAAFRYSAEAFRGPSPRIVGPMVHLWHPRLPQSVPGAPGYSEQFSIVAQYRDAAAIGPHAVRELVRSRSGRV